MADRKSPLPIQDHSIGITSRNAEADIEKCLWRKIGTRNIDRVRSTSGNICPVESEVANGWGRHQQKRTIDFGTSAVISTAPANDEDATVVKQGGCMARYGLRSCLRWN